MIWVRLLDILRIQIETDDIDYLKDVKENFTFYVDGFRFMPQYRAGGWNGKTCLLNTANRSLPYGLLTDLISFHKKNHPDKKLVIDEEVKKLFKGPELKIKYDLSLKPWSFQKDCIRSALKYTRGIIRSATASGKSLVISYIVKTLKENNICEKQIIVVPTQSLVEQFYDDMIEYGIDKKSIGRVYTKYKDWDSDIVISTWQTLSKNHERLNNYDTIIIDEVHQCKALQLRKILAKSKRAKYRLGFTGTLHAGNLDNLNTKAYLGPIIREYPSGLLAEEGYISKCKVKVINVDYLSEYSGNYNDIKDDIFKNNYRLGIIHDIIKLLNHNILILVGKVKSEGDFLKQYLSTFNDIKKEIVFLSGRDDVNIREKWRKECENRTDIVIIATYGIFQLGINIPSLRYIIFASPFKSKIRILQSIGRSLRKYSDKEYATIFDIADNVKYLDKQGPSRLRHYHSEGFNVEEISMKEGSIINPFQILSEISC
uniref:Putative type III restriction enzyme n=1 Tax=viral metagenome TaxID=1070528 RepID=A0A6M3JZ61_9ZZZZ